MRFPWPLLFYCRSSKLFSSVGTWRPGNDQCHAMIVDTIIRKDNVDYIQFKNTLQDGNQAEAKVELPLDSRELDRNFYFVHLKLKNNQSSHRS